MDLLSLAIGGVVGAAAAAVLAALRVRAAFERFSAAFREYMAGRNDPESISLTEDFEDLDENIHIFAAAFEKLKRALRR